VTRRAFFLPRLDFQQPALFACGGGIAAMGLGRHPDDDPKVPGVEALTSGIPLCLTTRRRAILLTPRVVS